MLSHHLTVKTEYFEEEEKEKKKTKTNKNLVGVFLI